LEAIRFRMLLWKGKGSRERIEPGKISHFLFGRKF
jgi:hypothetical protein